MPIITRLIAGALAGMATQLCVAQNLVVDFMVSSGAQRTAWESVLDKFAKENPDIKVSSNVFPQETYKADFEKRLATEKVDVAFSFAGEKLRQYASKKLIAPIDDGIVTTNMRPALVKATIDATEVAGKIYGFPLSYYQWGLFYRKSLLQKEGINPPASWAEFLTACEKLKTASIPCTGVGSQNGWPAAGWFDYLDLRINGIDFHRKLLRGEASFGDAKVRKVFDEWKTLLDKGYFIPNANSIDWDGVLPYLYRSQVGMLLMGGFAATKFPAELRADIGFIPFPKYADGPVYEEAPLDILVFPARGENHEARGKFLAFLAKSDSLNAFNEANSTISPKAGAPASKDAYLSAGKKMLDSASGITFFFDRDAKESMVKPAFDGLKKFLTPPFDAAGAVSQLEKTAK